MSTNRKLRVIVAHSEPIVSAGIHATLVRHGDFEVKAELPSSLGIKSLSPELVDVLITDCETAVRVADSTYTGINAFSLPVVVVTQDEREASIRGAIAVGIRGYLLLGTTEKALVQAVCGTARGGVFLDPLVATKMIDSLAGEAITRRELQVLHHLTMGSSNKVIAAQLRIAVGTVKSHIKRLFTKLDATTRAEAAAIARRRGLIRIGASEEVSPRSREANLGRLRGHLGQVHLASGSTSTLGHRAQAQLASH